jgi:phospholipid/cholesterol/gamma-HCH transport system substrate-binding protein
MKRDNVNYLLVGLFVLAMAIAFTVLLFAITGRSGPTDSYFVYYDNVGGLKFGTGVFYEGYRVGQIEELEPEIGTDGVRYKIELSVAAGWKIPADSVARVQSSGLISAVTIEIKEGSSSEVLAPGSTIAGEGQTDLFAVLNQAAGDFRQLSRDGIMPVLDNVNARVSEVAEELVRFRRDDLSPFVAMLHERVDQDLMTRSVALLDRLDASARGLQEILGEDNRAKVVDILGHVDDVAVNLNQLVTRIEDTREQMNAVLAALGGLATDNRDGIGSTVSSAESAMLELDHALEKVNEHLGAILHNLEGGSRHMNEFARAIRDNPARLIRNSETSEPGAP